MQRTDKSVKSVRWCPLLGVAALSWVLVACAPLPVADPGLPEAAAGMSTEPRNACELAQQRGASRSRFCAPAAGKQVEPPPRAKPVPEPARNEAARRGADSAEPQDSADGPVRESDQQGLASWYGPRFHGRRTASGEIFNRRDFTAAHRSLPFGTRVCVRSQLTGRAVVVRINDRGPFSGNRVIDVSQAAAQELGMLGLGIKPVELWLLEEGESDCFQSLSGSAP
ncbi:septal ring lytic transglycosylase RlpA family protein [Acidovorax soli]|uniref:septal ring lytic transglycosylase RlpA family protein n=1 Tax=Acidovorax soli TaxID=592050 RepID=UPI0032B15802